MPHTLLAIKRATVQMILVWLAVGIAPANLSPGSLPGQAAETVPVLDLTAEVSPDEQGYYRGIPGSSGGGATGGWRPGPGDTVHYQLPLAVEILGASANEDGNFVFEVSLRNTDNAPFDLPSSPKLTTIEKPVNKSRRIFFFELEPLGGSKPSVMALGLAATAGSTSIRGSFVRLDPGKSLRILLLAPSDLIRRSFSEESQKLTVKVICNEWMLDDNRFFLSGVSAELASINTIQFALHGGQMTLVRP
jgi:hypothetical protein